MHESRHAFLRILGVALFVGVPAISLGESLKSDSESVQSISPRPASPESVQTTNQSITLQLAKSPCAAAGENLLKHRGVRLVGVTPEYGTLFMTHKAVGDFTVLCFLREASLSFTSDRINLPATFFDSIGSLSKTALGFDGASSVARQCLKKAQSEKTVGLTEIETGKAHVGCQALAKDGDRNVVNIERRR